MANNYMLSAFEFVLHSTEERHFLEKLWETAAEAEAEEDESSRTPTPMEQSIMDSYWGWSLEFSNEGNVLWAYISSEEGGNADALVLGLQEFLKKFRPPTEFLCLTWAFTCSKPRAGEFGGGGVVFNSQKAKWLDALTELNKAQRRMEKAEAKRLGKAF